MVIRGGIPVPARSPSKGTISESWVTSSPSEGTWAWIVGRKKMRYERVLRRVWKFILKASEVETLVLRGVFEMRESL